MKATTITNKMTKKQVEDLVASAEVSKSEKIRKLFEAGLDVKAISEAIKVRYNFVYNVLQNYCIVNDIAIEKTEKVSKRDDIVVLLKTGMSLADVSRATKTNYNYIWKISKELKLEEEVKKVVENSGVAQ